MVAVTLIVWPRVGEVVLKVGVGEELIVVGLHRGIDEAAQLHGALLVGAAGEVLLQHRLHVGQVLALILRHGQEVAHERPAGVGCVQQVRHLGFVGGAAEPYGARAAEHTEGFVEVPNGGQEPPEIVAVEVVVLLKLTDVAVQVHQHVVEGEHPEDAVYVQDVFDVGDVVVQGIHQVDQFVPAIVRLHLVAGVVGRTVCAPVYEVGQVVGLRPRPCGRAALEAGVGLGAIVLRHKFLADGFRIAVQPEQLAVHGHVGVVRQRRVHILPQDLVGKHLADERRVFGHVAQLDVRKPVVFVVFVRVQLNVEGDAVDGHALGHDVVSAGVGLVQQLVPVACGEGDVYGLDGGQVVEVLGAGRHIEAEQEEG